MHEETIVYYPLPHEIHPPSLSQQFLRACENYKEAGMWQCSKGGAHHWVGNVDTSTLKGKWVCKKCGETRTHKQMTTPVKVFADGLNYRKA